MYIYMYTTYAQDIILVYCTSHSQGFPAPELVSVCLAALDEFLLHDCVRVPVDKFAKARGQSGGSTGLLSGGGEPGHLLCTVKC